MSSDKKFIVSHAPFWHDGSSISERSYHTMLAALPAVLFGIYQYGIAALAVVSFSISTAIIWEFLINKITHRPNTIGDGHAALMGMIFAMLLPVGTPWWIVLTGTFILVVIGKYIFGGIGSYAFNPMVLALSILMISWKSYFDFDGALATFNVDFLAIYPLGAVKHFGSASIESLSPFGLLMGQQIGALGSTFGLGLILGGLYLILRGFVRWEIPLSFLAGIFITAMIFNLSDSVRFAGPLFHILTGYTLIAAFFLATEDASSPVNSIPMLIYGAGAGVMTILIRNIGAHVEGVLYAILIMNLIAPLLDKIRPKAIGKVA
ncbi:MAG: RnfABCDGE type electron transport complex subunit D [Proteobacteria bacterium]|nr:RnfABCDGE type electron transport complex subunit D [Pseudomonadota bacterium]MBU4470907.1 RnfABCDGE type electron transport complex subunit D [Pseudomonadota bacterium]MCG2751905.1 RnfABCDGE type electron transport complex subunit D [Desulfobacteraceae bacterium]